MTARKFLSLVSILWSLKWQWVCLPGCAPMFSKVGIYKECYLWSCELKQNLALAFIFYSHHTWNFYKADWNLQLTGAAKETVILTWPFNDCQTVEISGLDIGWGQVTLVIPLQMISISWTCKIFPKLNKEQREW